MQSHECTCQITNLNLRDWNLFLRPAQIQKNLNSMYVNELFFLGHNKYGQSGCGEENHNRIYNIPKTITFNSFVKQVSCGSHHTALLTIDGLIYTMGSNIHGTLGLSDRPCNLPEQNLNRLCSNLSDNTNTFNTNTLNTNVFSNHSGSNSSAKCSINYALKPTLVRNLKDVDQIFSGSYHMCALKAGELYTWGKGIEGQLGHGTMSNLSVPTKVEALGDSVETVSCGLSHTLVLVKRKPNSNLNAYAFGSGIYGQLGNGINRNQSSPVGVKLPNVSCISAGQNHSLFLSDQQIYGCGDNTYLQLSQSLTMEKNKKYFVDPQKIQALFKTEDSQQKSSVCLTKCFDISVSLDHRGNIKVWGGKLKIWPAVCINGLGVIDVKIGKDCLFALCSEDKVKKIKFSKKEFKAEYQIEEILIGKTILGFDASQNHFFAIGDIVGQAQQHGQPQDILSVCSSLSDLSQIGKSSKHSEEEIDNFSRFTQAPSNQTQGQPFMKKNKKAQSKDSLEQKKTHITRHLKSGQSSRQSLYKGSQSNCQSSHDSINLNQKEQQILKHEKSSEIQVQNSLNKAINQSEQKKDLLLELKFAKKPSCTKFSPSKGNLSEDCLSTKQKDKLCRLMKDIESKTIHLKSHSQKDQSQLKQNKPINKREQRDDNSDIITPSKKHSKDPRGTDRKSSNQAEQDASKQFQKVKWNIREKEDDHEDSPNIESVFKVLLRKHYREKNRTDQIQTPDDTLLESSHDMIPKYSGDVNRLEHPKLEQQRSGRSYSNRNHLQLHNQSKTQYYKRESLNSLEKCPSEILKTSKISSKSNISCKTSMSAQKRTTNIAEIMRSNRELRASLRERDLKISSLQEELSKKEMQLAKMEMKEQRNTHKFCSKCSADISVGSLR